MARLSSIAALLAALLVAAGASPSTSAITSFSLSRTVGNSMVLQRDVAPSTPSPLSSLWGFGAPEGSAVTVSLLLPQSTPSPSMRQ
jgi:hypothetical protein